MSVQNWQSYVDTLVASGQVARALICGHDGAIWAHSSDFVPSGAELQTVLQGFNNQDGLYANGIVLAGTKFTFLRADPGRALYGRRIGGGVVAVRTGQTVVISTYETPMQADVCIKATQAMTDYLMAEGY